MKQYRVVLRDERQDKLGKLNPTAKVIILEATSEKKLFNLIVANAKVLFNENDLEYIAFAYTQEVNASL